MHLKSALKVTRFPLGAARAVVGQCPSRLYDLSQQYCDVLELPRDPWIELHDRTDERCEKERNTGELLADAVVQFVGQVLPFASDRIARCLHEIAETPCSLSRDSSLVAILEGASDGGYEAPQVALQDVVRRS